MMNDAYKQIEANESSMHFPLITPRKLQAVNDNHSYKFLKTIIQICGLILLAGSGMLLV